MSFHKELESLNISQLWCGKASAYEVLVAVLHAIDRESNSSQFPKYDSLLELKEFMETDKSHRYYSRMKEFQAPTGTEKVPLEHAKLSLLVKLIVHRIDDVCIKYFQSSTSSEWVPRNTYGEKVLKFWKLFDSKYPSDVSEFMKNYKPSDKPKEVHETKQSVDGLKSMLTKVQGAWAQKISNKIQELESNQVTQTEQVTEEVQVVPKVISKKTTSSKPKKSTKPQVETPVDDGQGEWTKVGTQKTRAPKNKDKYKPKNITK